jgi:hypothetical protein
MFLELICDKFGAEDNEFSCPDIKQAVTAITSVKQTSYWQADCRLADQETKISKLSFLTKQKKPVYELIWANEIVVSFMSYYMIQSRTEYIYHKIRCF